MEKVCHRTVVKSYNRNSGRVRWLWKPSKNAAAVNAGLAIFATRLIRQSKQVGRVALRRRNCWNTAIERVELIAKCAQESQRIDESLRTERRDARVAEQRAELHGELSAMLYGIEATPDAAPPDSAVEAVMARVQAYREIKNQIEQARGD